MNNLLNFIYKLFDHTADSCPLNEKEALTLISNCILLEKRFSRLEKITVTGFLLIATLIVIPEESQIYKELTKNIHLANHYYCNEKNETTRVILIEFIRKDLVPFYPDTGLCGTQQDIKKYVKQFIYTE